MGGTALASLSYSPEYEPGVADQALLARVSERTGGRGAIQPEQAFDAQGLHSGRSRIPLARWLVLAAALLWPLAVALSRLALRTSLVGQVRYAGATAVWLVRRRAPSLPGRSGRATTSGGRRRGPPDERPARPVRPVVVRDRSQDERKAKEAAPAAALGSLLSSQRRRRGLDDPVTTSERSDPPA